MTAFSMEACAVTLNNKKAEVMMERPAQEIVEHDKGLRPKLHWNSIWSASSCFQVKVPNVCTYYNLHEARLEATWFGLINKCKIPCACQYVCLYLSRYAMCPTVCSAKGQKRII